MTKQLFLGFLLGIAFTLFCGFSMDGYWNRNDLHTGNHLDLQDIAHNQEVLARMLESANCSTGR